MSLTCTNSPMTPSITTYFGLQSHTKFPQTSQSSKQGEDLGTHITTYHLWCISKSMVDDSIWLRLFPCALTGSVAKWYIELPHMSVNTFGALVMEFLKHFQLPIHYETGMELLTYLCKDTSTHISNHVHEWRRRHRLVKAPLPDNILVDWFCKSLLPKIAKDVTLGGAVTKYQSIHHAQHLDLIYSQSSTLYNNIPNSPRNSNAPANSANQCAH